MCVKVVDGVTCETYSDCQEQRWSVWLSYLGLRLLLLLLDRSWHLSQWVQQHKQKQMSNNQPQIRLFSFDLPLLPSVLNLADAHILTCFVFYDRKGAKMEKIHPLGFFTLT